MITFNTGNPCSALIVAEGYGLCQFIKDFENGDVQLYVGGNRMFIVSGKTRWRYAK